LTFFQFDPPHRVHWITGHLKCPKNYIAYIYKFCLQSCMQIKSVHFQQTTVAVNVGHKSNYKLFCLWKRNNFSSSPKFFSQIKDIYSMSSMNSTVII
jgi:hypothetical protein